MINAIAATVSANTRSQTQPSLRTNNNETFFVVGLIGNTVKVEPVTRAVLRGKNYSNEFINTVKVNTTVCTMRAVNTRIYITSCPKSAMSIAAKLAFECNVPESNIQIKDADMLSLTLWEYKSLKMSRQ